jgi:hypothetical protein
MIKTIVKKPIFKIKNKHIFLTYAQCNEKLEIILAFLQSTLAQKNILIKNYFLVIEDHKENSLNIGGNVYVYLELSAVLEGTNSRYFDYTDLQHNIHHPHIHGVKDKNKVIAYLSKTIIELNDRAIVLHNNKALFENVRVDERHISRVMIDLISPRRD